MKVSALILNPKNFYFIGLALIALGLSLSKPFISIGQMVLGYAWLIDKNKWTKTKEFFSSKLAWALISVYVLTVFGLVFTSDFDFAKNDIRRKLPFLVLPFLLFHQPLSFKEMKTIFKIYVGGVLLASFWSVFVKLGGLGVTIVDARELSRFNSHIRFGLEICLAIFGSLRYMYLADSKKEKLVWLIIVAWLTVFMGMISLMTGLIVLIITALILMLGFGHKIKSSRLKIVAYAIPLLIMMFGAYKLFSIRSLLQTKSNPLIEKSYTPDYGNYYHDKQSTQKENGYFVWRNNCFKELEKEWNKRSEFKYDGLDRKGQKVSATLIRFLTSKGVYKNARAVRALTKAEISAIENGLTNSMLMSFGIFEKRVYEMVWEYNNYIDGGDYNGHSLIMRLEYWKTAWQIFKDNKIFGVGTGDIQNAFDQKYQENNSLLEPKYRLRAHNQFLTIAATFGLFGLFIFLVFLVYPVLKTNSWLSYMYVAFLTISLVSMVTEDTLDTQIGITFFAFFNTLFILNKKAFEA